MTLFHDSAQASLLAPPPVGGGTTSRVRTTSKTQTLGHHHLRKGWGCCVTTTTTRHRMANFLHGMIILPHGETRKVCYFSLRNGERKETPGIAEGYRSPRSSVPTTCCVFVYLFMASFLFLAPLFSFSVCTDSNHDSSTFAVLTHVCGRNGGRKQKTTERRNPRVG